MSFQDDCKECILLVANTFGIFSSMSLLMLRGHRKMFGARDGVK